MQKDNTKLLFDQHQTNIEKLSKVIEYINRGSYIAAIHVIREIRDGSKKVIQKATES